MNVWYVLPSANFEMATRTLPAWRSIGYSIAVLIDAPGDDRYHDLADWIIVEEKYEGFPKAVNRLCKSFSKAPVIVVGGDDIYPDYRYQAEEIALEFIARYPTLYGVMQPTGDDYGATKRACVSPWIGRAFIEKHGPYCEEYYHFFCDQDLQEVAKQKGVFWPREDVCQIHDHWRRHGRKRPVHMQKAKRQHAADRRTFLRRKVDGFP